jgi:hypothetical protein
MWLTKSVLLSRAWNRGSVLSASESPASPNPLGTPPSCLVHAHATEHDLTIIEGMWQDDYDYHCLLNYDVFTSMPLTPTTK